MYTDHNPIFVISDLKFPHASSLFSHLVPFVNEIGTHLNRRIIVSYRGHSNLPVKLKKEYPFIQFFRIGDFRLPKIGVRIFRLVDEVLIPIKFFYL